MNIRYGLIIDPELKEQRRVAWVGRDVVAVLILLIEQVTALAGILFEVALGYPVLLLLHILSSLYLLLRAEVGAHHVDAGLVQRGLG